LQRGDQSNDAGPRSTGGLDRTARVVLTVATTLLVMLGFGLLVHYFYSMTVLLGIVLIVTYILLAPVNIMEKGIRLLFSWAHKLPIYGALVRRTPEAHPRILATFIVYAAFFLSLFVGSMEFLPLLSRQAGDLTQKIGVQLIEVSDDAIAWADRNVGQGILRHIFEQNIRQAERAGILKQHIGNGKPVTPEERRVIQKTVLESTLIQIENFISSAVPTVITLVGGTVGGFIYFLAGLLLSFYCLSDGHRIKEELLSVFPPRARETTAYLLNSFHQVMFSFIKGQVMLGLLTGLYMFIVYSIFHVPYAFLLGCVFAMAELLPVVGTWIGIGIGLTVILMNMPSIVAAEVWLCSYCYQTIKDNILAPKVVADVMGLHPMVIILSLMICGQTMGLLGILLALPLASAVNVVIRLFLDWDQLFSLQEDMNENIDVG